MKKALSKIRNPLAEHVAPPASTEPTGTENSVLEDYIDSDACFLCDREFTLTTWKHHCKRCKKTVCGKCSQHSADINGTKSPKRVCDECYVQWTNPDRGKSPSARSIRGQSVTGALREKFDVLSQYTQLKADWTLLLKPFYSKGATANIGTLSLKIVAARNLPDMDALGKSDPYIVIQFESNTIATKTRKNTLNPEWNNEDYMLPVKSALSSVTLSVYDKDFDSSDDFIGEVTFPLSALNHQEKVTEWVDLKLAPNVVESRRAKKKSLVNAQVRIEVQYTFSPFGEFSSFINLENPPVQSPEKFDISVTLAAIYMLLELLGPVFGFLGNVGSVLSWENPLKSGTVLLLYYYCCRCPKLVVLVLHAALIHHIVYNYIV